MITVERLTKRYGPFTAVDDVSFKATGPRDRLPRAERRRQVDHDARHVRPHPRTSGRRRPRQAVPGLPNPGRQVGVLLDASAQHAGRTGREVLTLGATSWASARHRVDEMLELVGLTEQEATAASATTRSACASASASRTPCSATRRC